jgi:hypothetical protein
VHFQKQLTQGQSRCHGITEEDVLSIGQGVGHLQQVICRESAVICWE